MLLAACSLCLATLNANFAAPLIIPRPKETYWSESYWTLSSRLSIVGSNDDLDIVAAKAIAREIVADGGVQPRIATRIPKHGDYILLCNGPSEAESHDVPKDPEGYRLDIRGGNRCAVIIAGRSPKGTLNGAESFCQTLWPSNGGVKAAIGRVRDWPTLGWRGVHLFLGNQAFPFHKKLIENVLNRFKLNHLVLECEEVKWKTLGDAAPDWGMSKGDLRKELSFARNHGLTVVPLVNTAAHMRWLCTNKRFKDLAEDPKTPVALC